MFNFNFSKGVLGLNARNLIYIKELNPRDRINFADSKLKTKHYLSARGIPVPKLYAVIKSHEDLLKFDFASLPGNIVLKPNKGSGGDGIIAFKERKGNNFITVNGRVVPLEELRSHIIDIIDGRFSMTNTRDIAFFEQRIQTDNQLAKYTYQGLPDVRIIVYNLVPVMAMLRLPTRESEGKANMAQGALGVGIDMGTGKPTYIAKKFDIIGEIPDVGKFDPKFKIPYWDEMLLIASKCQQITNLGYLACDIAIDENSGPILLELNARAGLKVQIANKAPLKKRLEQIKDIVVKTPEKGVRVAKDLFSVKDTKTKEINNKKVITLIEDVELIKGNNKHILKAKIDPYKTDAEICSKVCKDIGIIPSEKNSAKIKLTLKGEKIITIAKVKPIKGYDLILGNKEIQNFYLKPIIPVKKYKLDKPKAKKKDKDFFYVPQIDYGQVDFEIANIHKNIKFLLKVRPNNHNIEINKFKADPSYNPQFKYKLHSEFIFESINKLENIKTDDTPLGILFQQKIQELKDTIQTIQYIGTPEFTNKAKVLFPHPTEEELLLAEKYRKNFKNYSNLKDLKRLNAKEAELFFNDYLQKFKLKNWRVVLRENLVSDISVNKSSAIFIRSNAHFTELRLKKLLAHEIETHVFTAENGKRQPYEIFQNGTANYLETQEGLAIYNQELALQLQPHNYFASGNLYACDVILNNSFSHAVEILRRNGFDTNSAIKMTTKVKRGLEDTSQKGGIAKQAIYFRGAIKIDNFVKNGGKLEDLYIGKISIDQLELLKQIPSLNKPLYIPNWY
jgi:alpha-L-glutamate ligase-like protein/uncharacterized protein (TIGR02421 family)